jgi:uncharacterized glyoxalase superfamily protein PhnB
MVDGMSQSIYPSLAYEHAHDAIGWLGRAFGFEAGLVVPGEDGAILHAELLTGTGDRFMVVSTALSTRRNRNPRLLGGTSQSVYVVVADIDEAHDRAAAAGAEIFNPLHETGYGSREFCCLDPEGHIWTFGTYRPGA